ncbi:DNA-packaging protein [Allosphingosinicella flava]|uniref:DNA-packaging protein n=1 Tax=Allosphingosinicella flava TaxID=2771430 RepID=A0A7T2GLP9_9SPHN|nr:terminase family protein [Sphingosinicella flava]QPQ56087.1 DNA-packaging protein [Sphingosinicella flava]
MSGGDGLQEVIEALTDAEEDDHRWIVTRLTEPQKRTLNEHWPAWAHDGQIEPPGTWRTWLLMAGRGFGKTRAGAEWVCALARDHGDARIALVGGTAEDVRKVMIEGQSGVLAVAGTGERPRWESANGRLVFPSGAEAAIYSGGAPEKLRGPEHHFAWCDELAKWRFPDQAWSNLQLGLRLGERPRTLITTTPRPVRLIRELAAGGEGVAVHRGKTGENANLPPAFVKAMMRAYAGTRLGRQELDGELIDDVEGALWTRALIDACKVGDKPAGEWRRVVIGVDPPASAEGDACGIVAVGLGMDDAAYVIGDHSVQGARPEGWARAVAGAAARHGADRVIAEANNGGQMVESVLRAAETGLPVKLVHASRGKVARAEPVAALFETGRARFVGAFPDLEDELAGLVAGGGYQGPGRSPDRADALVWAMTELMLGKGAGAPSVRSL